MGRGDPVVARDLLVGTAMGSVIVVLTLIGLRLPVWLGRPVLPLWSDLGLDTLLSLRYGVGILAQVPMTAAALATATFLLLVLLRLVLKRELLAAAVLVALVGTLNGLRWGMPVLWALPVSLSITAGFMIVALRFGLLAYVVAATVVDLWLKIPLTADLVQLPGAAHCVRRRSWSSGPRSTPFAACGARRSGPETAVASVPTGRQLRLDDLNRRAEACDLAVAGRLLKGVVLRRHQ